LSDLKWSKARTRPLATAGLRVLIVDDDAYMRVLCSLEFPEIDMLEASGVEDGFRMALLQRPDVVVIDQHLRGRDGLELLRTLRDHEPTSQLPAVVVTAGHDESRRLEVMGAGADDYLRKPLEPEDFRRRIAGLAAMTAVDRWARRVELFSRLILNDDVIDLRDPPM
jgi:DNA-binding response OmpR family regulator